MSIFSASAQRSKDDTAQNASSSTLKSSHFFKKCWFCAQMCRLLSLALVMAVLCKYVFVYPEVEPRNVLLTNLVASSEGPQHRNSLPVAAGSTLTSTAACIRSHLRPRPLDFSWTKGGELIPAPRIAIVALFKNEAANMREWLEHHVEQGIDAFFLMDNDSTDAWQEEIKGFEEVVTVVRTSKRHAQLELYNTFALPWLKEQGFLITLLIDLDEFAFSTLGGGSTLADITWGIFNHSQDNLISQVYMHWHMFGSNGHTKQPPSVREGFVTGKKGDLLLHGKAFAKTFFVDSLGIHSHKSPQGVMLDEPISTMLGFQLNHYAIQSREWYEKTKLHRGAPESAQAENLRDWGYFSRYDWNETTDTTLRDLSRAWRKKHPECYPKH